jgi:hypothetical protein
MIVLIALGISFGAAVIVGSLLRSAGEAYPTLAEFETYRAETIALNKTRAARRVLKARDRASLRAS